MKSEKYSNEKIDEMLKNMSNGETPVNFEFAGEQKTKEEEQKPKNIVFVKRFVPIAAAFVLVIAATAIGVRFLDKDQVQLNDPSDMVTETPTEEVPTEESPTEETPTEETPTEETPTEETPTKEAPTEEAPTEGNPIIDSSEYWGYFDNEEEKPSSDSAPPSEYSAPLGHSNIKSIIISDSVTSINNSAFSSYTSLETINVIENNPNYSSLNGVLFNKDKTILIRYPCAKTGAYIIPDSVTSIDGCAFEYCSNLTSVTIPNSVTSIDNSAFSNCSENLIIYGTAGSYAETYAQENDIQFIAQ